MPLWRQALQVADGLLTTVRSRRRRGRRGDGEQRHDRRRQKIAHLELPRGVFRAYGDTCGRILAASSGAARGPKSGTPPFRGEAQRIQSRQGIYAAKSGECRIDRNRRNADKRRTLTSLDTHIDGEHHDEATDSTLQHGSLGARCSGRRSGCDRREMRALRSADEHTSKVSTTYKYRTVQRVQNVTRGTRT